MLKNPSVRLAARAVVAGLTTFATLLQAHDTWDGSLLRGAVVAGVLAALEYATPLNRTVGVGK